MCYIFLCKFQWNEIHNVHIFGTYAFHCPFNAIGGQGKIFKQFILNVHYTMSGSQENVALCSNFIVEKSLFYYVCFEPSLVYRVITYRIVQKITLFWPMVCSSGQNTRAKTSFILNLFGNTTTTYGCTIHLEFIIIIVFVIIKNLRPGIYLLRCMSICFRQKIR